MTIDGPAGAGKSTAAKRIAAALQYSLLDTGAMYRGLALVARRRGIGWDDEAALARLATTVVFSFACDGDDNQVFIDGVDESAAIRTPDISSGASQVSAHPAVRSGLLDAQRRLGAGGGVVVEGRDVGTVVFPQAEAKFFLTASPAVRADRRVRELTSRGIEANYQTTLEEIEQRDHRDRNRDVAPLTQAEDAVLVDSSSMSFNEVVESILSTIHDRLGQL